MSGRAGNPNMRVRSASVNPHGESKPLLSAKRTLALACREAATDEEVAEWLLEIASGRWPEIRPARKSSKNPDGVPSAIDTSVPPDGPQRMAALKEFLLRRDGQPMQSVVLKAEIDARARMISNASDAIELDDVDPAVAGAIEAALTRALGAANTQDAIDVDSTEVK